MICPSSELDHIDVCYLVAEHLIEVGVNGRLFGSLSGFRIDLRIYFLSYLSSSLSDVCLVRRVVRLGPSPLPTSGDSVG